MSDYKNCGSVLRIFDTLFKAHARNEKVVLIVSSFKSVLLNDHELREYLTKNGEDTSVIIIVEGDHSFDSIYEKLSSLF